jgi:hypothetical protein
MREMEFMQSQRSKSGMELEKNSPREEEKGNARYFISRLVTSSQEMQLVAKLQETLPVRLSKTTVS